MNLWKTILEVSGWSVDITAPRRNKCVICVAPHTSNWDFILGLFAYRSLGRKANFLMKKFWFFFPLKYLLRSLGGIPVDRKGNKSLTDRIISKFNDSSYVNLAVTPEGTRSKTSKWKTGFIYIAMGAHVPIQLGVIDYKHKKIIIKEEYQPSGDVESDLNNIKAYYKQFPAAGRFPDKFSI